MQPCFVGFLPLHTRVVSRIRPLCPLASSLPCSKLSIHLPHKVDGERGKAKWDSTKKVLSITLRIIREEPF